MKKQILLYTMAITMFLQTGPAFSLDAPRDFKLESTPPTPAQEQSEKQNEQGTNNAQLLTEEERAEFIAGMQSAKTNEEQEQIRREIHRIMQERARSHGLFLPGRPSETR